MRIVIADEISPTAAGCGTSQTERRSTRTASAATWAVTEAYQRSPAASDCMSTSRCERGGPVLVRSK